MANLTMLASDAVAVAEGRSACAFPTGRAADH
jgi:hypothetical protein